MPVYVTCPQCAHTLVAPDELIGKLAACPGCSAQFPITGGPDGPAAVPPPPPPGQPGSVSAQPRSQAAPPAAGSPPSAASVADASAPPAAPAVERAHVEAYAPPTKSSPKPAEVAAATQRVPTNRASKTARAAPKPPKPSQTQTDPARRAPVQRAAKAARFIAAEATDTSIQLGQDGQLPALVLQEGLAPEKEDESQTSSPYMLVAALCISLAASVGMLLLDPQVRRAERPDKSRARDLIEQFYISQPGQILTEPYQDELRAALQAHNQADYKTERRLYRRVIQRLKAENNNELKGLTGQVRAAQPPNDEDLEELLAILLRDD